MMGKFVITIIINLFIKFIYDLLKLLTIITLVIKLQRSQL